MVPAAAAITAWLVTGRAWRMALLWCLLFTFGLALVIASKISFLAWGAGVKSLDFKALSGHAMLTAAVIPVMFYLLLQRYQPFTQILGTALGILFSVIMVACLTAFHFHSLSEAIAGYLIGGSVSLGFIWMCGTSPLFQLNRWLIPCSICVFVVVWYVNPASIKHLMTNVAVHLSGNSTPYSWTTWQLAP